MINSQLTRAYQLGDLVGDGQEDLMSTVLVAALGRIVLAADPHVGEPPQPLSQVE